MNLGTLGMIGFGNMGSALADGLVEGEIYSHADIHIYDVDSEKVEIARGKGYFVHTSIDSLKERSDTIIIAVKPRVVREVLDSLKTGVRGKLIISIAAGVTLAAIETVLSSSPVIRVMPNTPCMVGAGVSAFARGDRTTEGNVETAVMILGTVGTVHELPESLMDAVTGLSGSGPAYVAMMIDALSDGGVKAGLDRKTALQLATETVFGTAKMIMEKNMHPSELRDIVASPGGTTIEGIHALEKGSFRAALINAVVSAANRSKEMRQ